MLPDLPQTEVAIVELTNAFRKAGALQQVKPNPALAAAARAFAEYLARTGKFAHEADGRKPEDRAQAQGYRYCLVAENLAWNLNSRGFESAQLAREVVEGWKASPGHREIFCCAGQPTSAWPSCGCRIGTRSFFRCNCSGGRSR